MDSNVIAALIGASATVVAAVITVLAKRPGRQPNGEKPIAITTSASADGSAAKQGNDIPLKSFMDDYDPDLDPEINEEESGWKQDEVFPLIEMVIEEAYREEQRYFTSREIAARLLRNNVARPIIVKAQRCRRDNATLDHVARNMVAWFTKRFLELALDKRFDKQRIKGLTAYKPKNAPGQGFADVRPP